MLRRFAMLSALLVSSLGFAADPPKPVKVFILAGHSNMEGQAVVDLDGKDYNDGKGTLVKLMQEPAKAGVFKHLKDADGKWIVRPDVWVRYKREEGPLLAGPLAMWTIVTLTSPSPAAVACFWIRPRSTAT